MQEHVASQISALDNQNPISRRNTLAQIFVVLLVSLAYQEMIAAMKESFRAQGTNWATIMLAVVFILTSLRFFIGAQFHLIDKRVLQMRGSVWLVDLLVISGEMVILILMGGAASVEASQMAGPSFYTYFLILLGVDVAWVAYQWLSGSLFRSLRRESIPWGWAILNTGIIGFLIAILLWAPDPYDSQVLTLLAAVALASFIIDVILIDHYELVGQSPA